MSIPSQGSYLPPLDFLSYVFHAARKTYRQSVPHFAVVKRINHAERRSRSSSLLHACPLPTPRPLIGTSHRRAVLVAHWIRQAPRMIAEVFCSIGRDITASPVLWAAAQHHGVSSTALSARTALDEVVATALEQLCRSALEEQQRPLDSPQVATQFTMLATLLPVRGLLMCTSRWIHYLLVADEIQIVRWLRSRQPEKWWFGMASRILTSAVSGVAENSLVLVLCVRAWFPEVRAEAGSPTTWAMADITTLQGKQQLVCALSAAILSATIRSYVIPRATTFLQRVLLWCFEEVEYFAMRRYADVGRHVYYDDVDESLLTQDEWLLQNARREADQRAAVLRAVGMRSAAWLFTRIALLHPLNSLMQMLNSLAVLWAFGIASPRQGNRILLGLTDNRGWFAWTYEQFQVELHDFWSVLVETSVSASPIMNGDGNVVQSLDVLARRLGALEPLYRGWQWTLLASLAALHVSTIGRITTALL